MYVDAYLCRVWFPINYSCCHNVMEGFFLSQNEYEFVNNYPL